MLPGDSFYTYLHWRADDDLVFYVGKGSGSRAFNFRGRNGHWRNTVRKHGILVDLVAWWSEEHDAFEHEKLLIACFKTLGHPLCNRTDGGEGLSGFKHSFATRVKLSGKPVSKEVREKIGKANRGRVRSADARARISASLSGRKRPPEVGAKISAAKKGRTTITQEMRERISKTLKGKKISDAAREKHLAWLRDPGRCARHSAAMKGRPWSAARRAAHEAKKKIDPPKS
jgi:hypothetical protein